VTPPSAPHTQSPVHTARSPVSGSCQVVRQGSAGGVTPSSAKPSQSSSWPSHSSGAGAGASQVPQPATPSQVSTPKQRPWSFSSRHDRSSPSFCGVQVQVPVSGRQRLTVSSPWSVSVQV